MKNVLEGGTDSPNACKRGRFRRNRPTGGGMRAHHFGGVLLVLASWPNVGWYLDRMRDGADEPWGVLALAAAILFCVFGWKQEVRPWRFLFAGACLILALGLAAWLTPLLVSLLLFLALACLLVDRRCWLGHSGLFVLALPLISSLQFYGGYPLRWLVGKLSAGLLAMLGHAVEVQGTVMKWRGEMIVIDAPCSGVQMLWGSAFLACVLICIQKSDFKRSIVVLQVASLSAFFGNVVRNVLLFYLESGLVGSTEWAHEAVGLAVFISVLAVVVWVGGKEGPAVGGGRGGRFGAKRLRDFLGFLEGRLSRRPQRFDPAVRTTWKSSLLASWTLGGRGGVHAVIFALCLFAYVLLRPEPARRLPEGAIVGSDLFEQVRSELFRDGWFEAKLDDGAQAYASGFPGTIEIYEKEGRSMVVRVVNRATRRYHLSADCYRAIGYRIEPMPILREMDGSMWGRVLAEREGERIEVRERVVSLDGQSWTDPSSWFWSAALGKSEGPWVGYSESVALFE